LLHYSRADTAAKPKLVVAIIGDQFRYEYLQRFSADYHAGFKRLVEQGAVMDNAYYIHAGTDTAPGHSTLLSGATPSISGIIANEWYDRASKLSVTSVEDHVTTLVGGVPGEVAASPVSLLVETLGDKIRQQGGDSRMVGVSFKDRAAILPAGLDGGDQSFAAVHAGFRSTVVWARREERRRTVLHDGGGR
jgi:predicted AlkP superfamily pyrophosphatase or phosphodiesterase